MERRRCYAIIDAVPCLPTSLSYIIASYICWLPGLIIPHGRLSYEMVSTRTIEDAVALQMGECLVHNTEIDPVLWERLVKLYGLDKANLWSERISIFLNPGPIMPHDDIGLGLFLFLTKYDAQYILSLNISAVLKRSDLLEFLLAQGTVLDYTDTYRASKSREIYDVIRRYPPQRLPPVVNMFFDRIVEGDPTLAHILMQHPDCAPRLSDPDLLVLQMRRLKLGLGNVSECVLEMHVEIAKFLLLHNPGHARVVKALPVRSNPFMQDLKDYASTFPDPPSSFCQVM